MVLFLQLLKNIVLPPFGPTVSDKNHCIAVMLTAFPLQVSIIPLPPLAAVKSFSLSSAFSGLVLMCVGMDSFEFVLFEVHSSLIV